jgi:hypothetical protein
MKNLAALPAAVVLATGLCIAGCGGGDDDVVILPNVPSGGVFASSGAFLVQPGNVVANQLIAPAVQFELRDAAGNRLTSYNGPVTVFLAGGEASGARLVGTTTVQANNGVAVFSDLRVQGVGTGLQLVVSGAGLGTVSSAPFNVVATEFSRFSQNTGLLSPVGQGPTHVATADFNQDGRPDYAVANAFSDSVSIRLGSPDGPTGIPASGDLLTNARPTLVLAGDVNADGNPDLIVAHQNSSNIRLFRGNGDGTFQAPLDTALPQPARGGQLANVDADADLDLVLALPGGNQSVVLLNNGNGTFTQADLLPGTSPVQANVGLLNGDAFPDVVVTNDATDDIAIYFGNGTGTFAAAPDRSIATGDRPRHTLVRNLDGDGDNDLVVTSLETDQVFILLNDGSGNFATSAVSVRDQAFWTDGGDFDGDGDVDLVVTHRADNNAQLLLNNGSGVFTASTILPLGEDPTAVLVSNYNGDAFADLVVAVQGANALALVPGRAGGTFGVPTPLGQADNVFVATADFTGDNVLDFVASERNNNRVALYRGLGNGTFAAPVFFAVNVRPQEIAVGDFAEGNGLDLAVTGFNSDRVDILVNDGAGAFSNPVDLVTQDRPFSIASGDLDADGNLDLVVGHANQAAAAESGVRVFWGNGAGAFPAQSDLDLFEGSESVAVRVGDVTGDGVPDVVAGERLGAVSRLTVFRNQSGRNFARQDWGALPQQPRHLELADITGDGRLDAVVSYATGGDQTLFSTHRNTGSAFELLDLALEQTINNAVHSTKLADLNGDGALDFVVPEQGGGLLLFLNSGNGRFAAPSPTQPRPMGGSEPFHIDTGDFNGDGKVDFVVANHREGGTGGRGGVTVLLQP